MVHLVMSCLQFGLQVWRRMKVLAFLPGASAFNVIHADCHTIIRHFNHRNIRRVSIATIILPTGTISTLKFTANLEKGTKTKPHISSDDLKVTGFCLPSNKIWESHIHFVIYVGNSFKRWRVIESNINPKIKNTISISRGGSHFPQR